MDDVDTPPPTCGDAAAPPPTPNWRTTKRAALPGVVVGVTTVAFGVGVTTVFTGVVVTPLPRITPASCMAAFTAAPETAGERCASGVRVLLLAGVDAKDRGVVPGVMLGVDAPERGVVDGSGESPLHSLSSINIAAAAVFWEEEYNEEREVMVGMM